MKSFHSESFVELSSHPVRFTRTWLNFGAELKKNGKDAWWKKLYYL
jgi:hypothetical protein